MDFSRLGTGHKIAAGAGALLLIDLFLSWYSLSDDYLRDVGAAFTNIDTSATGWQAFSLLDILLAVAALMALAAAAQHMRLLTLPVRLSSVLTPVGAILTIWVLYRIINQPDDNDAVSVSIGAYLGLLLTALMTYGAMRAQNEAESVGPADVNTGATAAPDPPAAPATPATPPPPPAAPTAPGGPVGDDPPPPPAPPPPGPTTV